MPLNDGDWEEGSGDCRAAVTLAVALLFAALAVYLAWVQP